MLYWNWHSCKGFRDIMSSVTWPFDSHCAVECGLFLIPSVYLIPYTVRPTEISYIKPRILRICTFPNYGSLLHCFLSDKCVSESSEWRADRCQRTWNICHRQENDTGRTFSVFYTVQWCSHKKFYFTLGGLLKPKHIPTFSPNFFLSSPHVCLSRESLS